MTAFHDEELLAFADEQLNAERSVLLEQALRHDSELMSRLRELLSERDQGSHTVGEIWRRERLSCPSRAVWAAFVEGRLGDGLSQYLRFHVDVIGCRLCEANLLDLQQSESARNQDRRAQKIFQSSAGYLPRKPM